MPDPTTLEEALAVIQARDVRITVLEPFETQVGELKESNTKLTTEVSTAKTQTGELTTKVEALTTSAASAKTQFDEISASGETVKAQLTEAQATVETNKLAATELVTVKTERDNLSETLTKGYVARLTGEHKLKPDLVQGKTITELAAMEAAMSGVPAVEAPKAPPGGGNPPFPTKGAGLGGGGGSGGGNTLSEFEQDLATIEKLKGVTPTS